MDTKHPKAVTAAVCAAALMGTLGYFVRSSGCSAQLCAFVRFVTGLALLAPLLPLRRGWRSLIQPSWMSMTAGVGISLCILFYFLALQCIPLGIAALMVYVGPVIAAVAESVWNRRLPSLHDALPMGLSLAGIVAVAVFADAPAGQEMPVFNHQGILYSVLSAVSYAVYLVLNSRIPDEVSLSCRTYWQFVAGCGVLTVSLLFHHDGGSTMVQGWPYLLIIGVCHGLVVMLLIAYAARRLSAVQYGTFAYLEPAVAVLVGCLVYAEQMSAGQWCGFALVLTAAGLQALPRRKATFAPLTKEV